MMSGFFIVLNFAGFKPLRVSFLVSGRFAFWQQCFTALCTDQVDKATEEVMGIFRAWACFRMVLNRENRLADNLQTTIRAIKQRYMRFFNMLRQAV